MEQIDYINKLREELAMEVKVAKVMQDKARMWSLSEDCLVLAAYCEVMQDYEGTPAGDIVFARMVEIGSKYGVGWDFESATVIEVR